MAVSSVKITNQQMPTLMSECKNHQADLFKSSTIVAHVKTTHSWLEATDAKQQMIVGVLMADMSMAFEKVNPLQLMQDLVNIELCPTL